MCALGLIMGVFIGLTLGSMQTKSGLSLTFCVEVVVAQKWLGQHAKERAHLTFWAPNIEKHFSQSSEKIKRQL